jgi:hypothetical protein
VKFEGSQALFAAGFQDSFLEQALRKIVER